ncbi:MAG: quinolinate synthase NadA [Candidatus Cloacimonetes bacterium]|nr:quinolinate synthase NadA [Candidatus Cloacimonadota bacterium]
MLTGKEIKDRIINFKHARKAVILAHNYQLMEVQHIADYCGDSLELARLASQLDQEMIVFCGVRFMAETAKLLNPQAKVLLPVKEAGCPMAGMITADQLLEFKSGYEAPWVVCYVNSSIEVKAESDICCTSGNVLDVISSIPIDKQILFVPDRNLGSYAARMTGRSIILWEGYCNVHENISVIDVERAKMKYPGYSLAVHPECRPEVLEMADIIASTRGLADFVAMHDKVIIGTELGLLHQLQEEYPDKKLAALSEKALCVNMKRTTVTDVLRAFKNEEYEVTISEEVASRALKAVERMLRI